MRDFSWGCFEVTGNIDAYLLYKDIEGIPEGVLEVDPTEVNEGDQID